MIIFDTKVMIMEKKKTGFMAGLKGLLKDPTHEEKIHSMKRERQLLFEKKKLYAAKIKVAKRKKILSSYESSGSKGTGIVGWATNASANLDKSGYTLGMPKSDNIGLNMPKDTGWGGNLFGQSSPKIKVKRKKSRVKVIYRRKPRRIRRKVRIVYI